MASGLSTMLQAFFGLGAVISALLTSFLYADRAETRDGSILYGKIIGAKDGNLTLETDYAGLIHIPLKHLTSLSSSDSLSIRDENNETFSGQSIPLPKDQLNLLNQNKSHNLAFTEIQHLWISPSADPVFIEREKSELEKEMKWQNSIGFDWVGSSGNTDSNGLGIRLDSIYSNHLHELDLFLSYNTQTTNGQSDTDETKVGAEFDSLFSDRSAWYLRSDFEHDPIEKINLRNTSATGIKYDWINGENYNISIRVGTAYRYTESTEKLIAKKSDPAFDFGLEYNHLVSEQLALGSELSLIPKVNDLSDYLFNHDSSVTFPILEDSAWRLRSGLSGTYNSFPQDDSEKMDMKYYFRVVYDFQ